MNASNQLRMTVFASLCAAPLASLYFNFDIPEIIKPWVQMNVLNYVVDVLKQSSRFRFFRCGGRCRGQ